MTTSTLNMPSSLTGGWTRRGFLKTAVLAGVGVLVPWGKILAQGAGQDIGNIAKRLVIFQDTGWPWKASFFRYSRKAVFKDIEEANKKVRGRRYPVRIRQQ